MGLAPQLLLGLPDQIGHAPRPVCVGRWAAEPGKARIIGKTNLQKRALRLRVERVRRVNLPVYDFCPRMLVRLVAPRLWWGSGSVPLLSFALGAWLRLCDETSGKGVGIGIWSVRQRRLSDDIVAQLEAMILRAR